MQKPISVSKRAWEIAGRLYKAREEIEGEEEVAMMSAQDGQWTWMKLAAELISECQVCVGTGVLNTGTHEAMRCYECGGKGQIL